MKQKKKLSLAAQIFIGLFLGIIAGFIFLAAGKAEWTVAYIKPFGTIFLNLIKFIVVPIVLCSIIGGVISMKDIRKVGSIGWKTVVFYMATTAFAVVIGLTVANIFKGSYQVLQTSDLEYEVSATTKFMDTLVNIFPSNIIQPLSSATMLQVIVIALFFGFGIILAG
jgi:Na+/H+-dicarboxylate symporter